MEFIQGEEALRTFGKEWYKICAAIMFKLGKSEIEITEEDVVAFDAFKPCVILDVRGGRVAVHLMKEEEVDAFVAGIKGACNGHTADA